VEDIVAVLDAVGCERASILGVSEGAGVAALMASTHPQRTASVVFYGALCQLTGIEHPLGWHDEAVLAQFFTMLADGWGVDEVVANFAVPLWAPSMVGDEEFARWLARYARQSASRNEIDPLVTALLGYRLVDVFPAVRVPALVLCRRGDQIAPVGYA